MATTNRYIRLLPILIALVLLAGALSAAPARAAGGSVSPQSGGAGTRFNFNADGFTPGERVDSWVTGPDGSVAPRYPAVYADASGAIVWSWDAAAGTASGAWDMTARGIKSDLRVVIGFTVTGPSSATSGGSVSPASGPPGTSFSFSASGLRAGERVGAWLTTPDGQSRDFDPGKEFRAYADASGAVSWSWAAPSDAATGGWQANLRGLDSGTQIGIAFRITGPPQSEPIRSVAPTSGPPGTTFRVTVAGFTPGEVAGSWLNRPDGGRVEATPYLKADDAGVVTWQWTAPADAPGGAWQAVTLGRDSGRQVVLDFTVAGANPAPTGPSVSGSVSPTSGAPGATLSFSASGFAARETVNYWATAPDSKVQVNAAETQADTQGNAAWTWTIPASAIAGQWTLTAKGDSSARIVQIGFTVLPGGTTPSASTVTPSSGPVGTTFVFTADGFRDKPEKVFFWFIDPSGKNVDGPEWKRNDEGGAVTWQWTAPQSAVGGAWRAVAHGEKSGVERLIPFTIVRDAPPATAGAAVSPESGPAGTTFVFTANGYEEGERVGYWLNLPDGTVVRFDQELTGDAKGVVTWSWTAPADAQRGLYTMACRSSQSEKNGKIPHDIAYAIRFTVR